MNKLIAIALFGIALSAQAQSKLEKALVKQINLFRVANGLDTVTYSPELSRASRHHAIWSSKLGITSHEETVSIKGQKQLVEMRDRFNEYSEPFGVIGANENMTIIYSVDGDPEQVAAHIVDIFRWSDGHCESMSIDFETSNVVPLVGVSIVKTQFSEEYARWAVVVNFGAKHRTSRK